MRFPLPAPARVAVMGATFRLAPNMREFLPEDVAGLRDYDPEALVVPVDLALTLAEMKQRGLLELPSFKRAIIVISALTAGETPPLTTRQRDFLWSAFLLPIFEQLRGTDGKVFARECEVHDGLHVTQIPAGIVAETTLEPCDCGLETPRLRNIGKPKARVAAA